MHRQHHNKNQAGFQAGGNQDGIDAVADLVARETAALELEKFLPHRLSLLSSLTGQALATIHGPHGLNRSEWMVLSSIAERGQTTAKDIGALFYMQKAKVSRAVAGLLERELISRRRNPRDHRLALLELSPRGQELYSQCAPAAAAVGHQLEQALEMADREVLLRCLAKLAQTAQLLIAQMPSAEELGAPQT
jgi:DNA-binding MarR family transcriptional regulator